MAKNTKATPGTAVTNYKEEMKQELEEMKSRIQAPSGDVIRVTQDKKFQMPDGAKSEGPLSVVILDFVASNQFHNRPFKKGEEAPPACFAIGLKPQELVPDSSSPDIQSEACMVCPNNEWKSRGNGKACDNLRILAVTEPGEAEEGKPKSILVLKVSPTAIKAFDAYVDTLKSQFDALPIGIVTEIYFDPNLDYPSLRFGNPTPNEFVEEDYALKKAARARLMRAPDVSRYKAPEAVKPAGKKGK